jgi:hypothetical protein
MPLKVLRVSLAALVVSVEATDSFLTLPCSHSTPYFPPRAQNIAQHFAEDNEATPGDDLVEPLPLMCETSLIGALDQIVAESKGDGHGTMKWDDVELQENVEWLHSALHRNHKALRSIDRYKAELTAGIMRGGPTHAPAFWRENVRAFEKDGFSLVLRLHALLLSEEASHETLAVAVADVGQFAVYHPQGKTVLVGLGVKNTVMGLLECPSTEVRQQALITLSKLMIVKWEFVTPEVTTRGTTATATTTTSGDARSGAGREKEG